MAGAPTAVMNPAAMHAGPPFGASRLDSALMSSRLIGAGLMGSQLMGSGTIRSGLTVIAAEGAPQASSGPIDAVALRFEDFYAAHRDEMARALGLALRDSALGAEAADEAFARACQRWGQVSSYANPQGWIFRVALNWARSWLRDGSGASASAGRCWLNPTPPRTVPAIWISNAPSRPSTMPIVQ